MLFNYKGITPDGTVKQGVIEAAAQSSAVATLQKKNLVVLDIAPAEKRSFGNITIFERVTSKDIVILSRQLSTLFEAQVTVINSFRLMAQQAEKGIIRNIMNKIVESLQSGMTVSQALSQHPKVFSEFYINIVRVAEETGKLSETFLYLADYLERQYELVGKARHAMVYPSIVIIVFILVMGLMFTTVIPNLTSILVEAEVDLPLPTVIVIAVSSFFQNFGIFLLLVLVLGALGVWRYSLTEPGAALLSQIKFGLPAFGNLFQKFYLSRVSDNLEATITSGIPMVRAIEITANVVGDYTYRQVLLKALQEVKAGSPLSRSLSESAMIPPIMVQMVRIGEETGKLGYVLSTVSRFYKREVERAIESLITIIEPVMIVILGAGVLIILLSVFLPIYNLAGAF